MKITEKMIIADVLRDYPETMPVFLENGIQCLGCHGASTETLADGLKGHGKSAKEIKDIVLTLNKTVNQWIKVKKGAESSFGISDLAVKVVKEIIVKEKKKYLRFTAKKGECCVEYDLAFDDKSTKDDIKIEKEGVTVVASKETIKLAKGAIIDFIQTQSGAGFRIIGKKKECSCG